MSAASVEHDLLTHAIREALDAVASEGVRERILAAATRASGGRLPTRGIKLKAFVELHLRDAVRQALGADIADSVIAELAPIVDMASMDEEISEVRQTDRPVVDLQDVEVDVELEEAEDPAERITAERRLPDFDDPSGERATLRAGGTVMAPVVIATRDLRKVREMRWLLEEIAPLHHAKDAVELLDALVDLGPGPTIVLDCVTPAVHPSTLATVSPDLPAGTVVIMWGASENTKRDTGEIGKGVRWVRCDAEASTEDIVALLTALSAK